MRTRITRLRSAAIYLAAGIVEHRFEAAAQGPRQRAEGTGEVGLGLVRIEVGVGHLDKAGGDLRTPVEEGGEHEEAGSRTVSDFFGKSVVHVGPPGTSLSVPSGDQGETLL